MYKRVQSKYDSRCKDFCALFLFNLISLKKLLLFLKKKTYSFKRNRKKILQRFCIFLDFLQKQIRGIFFSGVFAEMMMMMMMI
jgi:hypothetical protein